MKCTYFNSTSFTKLRSFFHKASFLINKLFPPLSEVRKTLLWNVGTLHSRRVSALSQNGILGVLLPGGQKDGSRRVLYREWRDYEAEETTSLFQFPPLCTDWCAVCDLALSWTSSRRTGCIFLSGRTLLTRCFNFINVCTFRSQLNVAPLSKNSSDNVPSLFQKTEAMMLPAAVCILNLFPFMATTVHTIPLIVFSLIGRNDERDFHHW